MFLNINGMVSSIIDPIGKSALGPFAGFLLGAGLFFLIIIIVAFYVYSCWAWMDIAKKRKYKRPWLAWIPIANIAMILELGEFHWAWVFLILIPYLGALALFILSIISYWRIFKAMKYPAGLALIPIAELIPIINILALVAWLVVIGIVAWKKQN